MYEDLSTTRLEALVRSSTISFRPHPTYVRVCVCVVGPFFFFGAVKRGGERNDLDGPLCSPPLEGALLYTLGT